MVDKAGLQIIGWMFGGATAVVCVVAALLVGQVIAADASAPEPAKIAFAVTGI